MSEFSDDWLALRAPADSVARADRLVSDLAGLPATRSGVLEVLDLGCGTGANLRHLAPLLAAAGHSRQRWTCVDHDPALLARLPARLGAWAEALRLDVLSAGTGLCVQADAWRADVAWEALDLAAEAQRLPLPAGGLVTASALLDLVSEPWLAALLQRCRAAACALLFVLSYDGRCALTPAHPDDPRVVALFNHHQRMDKGFGPALGPTATATAANCCRALGYRVRLAPSDWRIGSEQPGLQRALLTGWRDAVAELAVIDAGDAGWLDGWCTAHLARIETGALRLLVGHMDLLALP